MAAQAKSKGCGRDLVSFEGLAANRALGLRITSGTVLIGLRVRIANGTLAAPMCMLVMLWVKGG